MVGVLTSRERAHKGIPAGSSLADVDPMAIDTKVCVIYLTVRFCDICCKLFMTFLSGSCQGDKIAGRRSLSYCKKSCLFTFPR